MKILEYHYHDIGEPGWYFDPVTFDSINLLVGDTATGKTRLLNTIFNLGKFVVAGQEAVAGNWRIVFEHTDIVYEWDLQIETPNDGPGIVMMDNLAMVIDGGKRQIVQRQADSFEFDGDKLPKLDRTWPSIYLLREEKLIRPAFEAFSLILRRNFSENGLGELSKVQTIPPLVASQMKDTRDVRKLLAANLNISANLYFLKRYFRQQYNHIVEFYKRAFPFVQTIDIVELSQLDLRLVGGGTLPKLPGHTPVIILQEHDSALRVPILDFSSGMTKVLLILTDLYILPEGGVYIIDEYENSLGISAIDFFPEFILDFEKDLQFFVTSHHPYIINNIPLGNWYLFHRKGMTVSIRHGEDVVNRFSSSRQEAFIQLISDPFYTQGVE